VEFGGESSEEDSSNVSLDGFKTMLIWFTPI